VENRKRYGWFSKSIQFNYFTYFIEKKIVIIADVYFYTLTKLLQD